MNALYSYINVINVRCANCSILLSMNISRLLHSNLKFPKINPVFNGSKGKAWVSRKILRYREHIINKRNNIMNIRNKKNVCQYLGLRVFIE